MTVLLSSSFKLQMRMSGKRRSHSGDSCRAKEFTKIQRANQGAPSSQVIRDKGGHVTASHDRYSLVM